MQCDSGHLHGDLIAYARYRIYDLRTNRDKEQITHVLFIIHLPQQVVGSSFVGFQGDPWISTHIDDLRQPSDIVVSTKEVIGLTISEFFLGMSKPDDISLTEPISTEIERNFSEEVLSESDEDEFFDALESLGDTDSADNIMDEDFELSLECISNTSQDPQPEKVHVLSDTLHMHEDDQAHVLASDSEPAEPFDMDTAISQYIAASGECSPRLCFHKAPHFMRLHNSIQAAASRLKDTTKRSTKRVKILVQLIPRELPMEPGGPETMY